MKLLPLVLIVTAAQAFAQGPGGPAAPEASVELPVVVTVGEGVVHATPDRAWITISAESRARNPKDAQQRNAEAMTPVIDKLRAEGIAGDAVKTIGYDLQQEWDFVNNQRVSRGYVARNTIEVRVDEIDRVGELLEAVVVSGATSVSGVRFDLKDRTKLEREALRLAVEDARGRADAVAAAAGRAIAGVRRIDVVPSTPVPMPRLAMARESAVSADAPPIAVGQIEIREQVTVTSILK